MNTQPVAAAASSAFPLFPAFALFAVLLVIAVGFVLYTNARKSKQKSAVIVKLPSDARKPIDSPSAQLIDAYCLAAQALDQWESRSVYSAAFLRAVSPLQTCLGLRRCVLLEGKDGAWLCDRLSTMFSNEQPRLGLTSQGLRIDKKPVAKADEDALRKKCSALSPAVLQAETAKLQTRLEAKKAASLPYEALIANAGPLLWQLLAQAQAGDAAGALSSIDALEKTLLRVGCIPLFYDDPQIAAKERLRVQFIADSPYCVELPGFYMKWNDEPELIGGCAGTRRE